MCEVSSRSVWLVHIFSKMDLSLATAWPSCVPTSHCPQAWPGHHTGLLWVHLECQPPGRWAFTKACRSPFPGKVHPFLASPFLGSTRLLGLGPAPPWGVSQLSTHWGIVASVPLASRSHMNMGSRVPGAQQIQDRDKQA